MRVQYLFKLLIFSITCVLVFSFSGHVPGHHSKIHFPYKRAGLTQRQAAAHLLSRFSYGAKAGQVDEVIKMGLENWFEHQLNGDLPDDSLRLKLASYDALNFTNAEVLARFPKGYIVQRMAIADSVINKDSVSKGDPKGYKKQLDDYMKLKGLRPEQELFRQFINQKILKSAYSNNQLQEVLTDFWFNHFNVSITKNDCAQFIPEYERDVIQRNASGKFQDLLLASAKSPAMLIYLDNFTSAGVNTNPDLLGNEQFKRLLAERQKMIKDTSQKEALIVKKLEDAIRTQGLNENYAREVMELHTLGVDGGYTQKDVTEAARVLTGWTLYPIGTDGYSTAIKKLIDKTGEDKLTQLGYVHDGDFWFAMNRHDNKEKTVLGKTFATGGGYDEGIQLLEMLAHHPSTAKFICRKLAVRFVSDDPPKNLIDKMAKTFLASDGDIKEVLITMTTSKEFWSKDIIREKTKSPFELAISAIRVLNANVEQPYQVFNLIDKMGEKIYYYQAPTGFPDKGVYWINTGSLLNRMNFGLAIASQRIPGIKINLLSLNNNHEPESASAALLAYGKLIMPERDIDPTVKLLAPLLTEPGLMKKVNEVAIKTPVAQPVIQDKNNNASSANSMMIEEDKKPAVVEKPAKQLEKKPPVTASDTNPMLSQVVGIIIGSPEFQRK